MHSLVVGGGVVPSRCMDVNGRLCEHSGLELDQIEQHTIGRLNHMNLSGSFENTKAAEEIRTPPIQGHLLEVPAEAMEWNANVGLHMIDEIRTLDRRGEFFCRPPNHRELLPQGFYGHAMIEVECLDKGLALRKGT